MSQMTDDPDMTRLGVELLGHAPLSPRPDRVRARGRALRQRQRRITAAIATVVVVLATVPVLQHLNQPGTVDLIAPPTGTMTSTVDPALLPDAVLAVTGARSAHEFDDADWAVLSLDGTPSHPVMPVFDPGEVTGFDVAPNADGADFIVGWLRSDDDGSQVGVGRSSGLGLGFGAVREPTLADPTGVALSPLGDWLAWTGLRDGAWVVEYSAITPPGRDVPPEVTQELLPDGTGVGSISGGSNGRPTMTASVRVLALDGPTDLSLDDWTSQADGTELLTYRTTDGAVWTQVVQRTSSLDLVGGELTPVPPTADGRIVIDRAPTGREPGAPVALLLQDPADGSIHLRAADDGPTVRVGAAGSDATTWSLDALEGAAVVSDGRTGWLLALDGSGWTAPARLPGEARSALLVPIAHP